MDIVEAFHIASSIVEHKEGLEVAWGGGGKTKEISMKSMGGKEERLW